MVARLLDSASVAGLRSVFAVTPSIHRCHRALAGGLSALTLILASACAPAALRTDTGANMPDYPDSRRTGDVDDHHGTRVADPYRWMEATDSPPVRDWVQAQNALSQPYLEAIPARERIRARLAGLWAYEQYGYAWMRTKGRVPVRRGARYFFVEKRGAENLGVLYWTPALDAAPRALLDPNTMSGDATVSVADFVVSPDGRRVAYATSDGGSDWDSWRVRDVDSGSDLPDEIRYTKFTSVSFTPDGGAFYYSRYPAGADGSGDDQQQVRVYRHEVGTPQSADEFVYAIEDHPRRNPYAQLSADGRWLLLQITDGFQSNAFMIRDQSAGEERFRPLLDRWDGLYEFLGNDGETLYFKTTQGAPRGRVVAVPAAAPQPSNWREVVREQAERLDEASLVGGHVIATYLKDAASVVRVHRLDGSLRNEVRLPGAGTVLGFPEDPAHDETFFSYTDYLTPLALYRYDVARDEVTPYRTPTVPFDRSPYLTEQVFYESGDGTRVPMSITRRRDVQLDGANPVLLYGYGGFDLSMTPAYSPAVAAWLELGGLYAVANLRGGGEYGEAWHAAGTRLAKQNVFDDFIAAAEWLIAQGYTAPRRLAIHGRSNGGLLVGAVMLQRPELFGAALPGLGVLDMLRYHTASANAYAWSSDYGTAEDAAEFAALRAYSPVHNVRDGSCYPPTLITTADRDDRVVPWHSYKFAAALQHAQGCANPVLIRVETRAGHGAGKPAWMQVENWADQWAFLVRHLGME